ncbi:TIGR01777 family oxidoreductase [Thiomicrospira cyclica]|uniref:NAD-dependent epimerase/dehydratase n=1 Tax=Thiomicrospira cyclica (strain DSM 14477 / JCM 11371 / ALM1) TaxID=717773 RepID=F6DAA2_THICA|nr:TIGR01777 family oxidoreductase [Thiomicrospira cyclica]AEG31068.1 domain of unknown function DUF1731 [Thiomicrospira cyclica ALM1]
MKIVILGGTGFVGKHLAKHLSQQGHQVTAQGRSAFKDLDHLTQLIDEQDVVIQLAGANIGERWNEAYKKELYDSRITTSGLLKKALEKANQPPQRILAASAIGIYPQRPCGQPLDEQCTDIDPGFLGHLGQAWEMANAQLSPTPLIMRFGVVLGLDGGALAKMLPAFRLGGGGPVAGGQQCFSWIHIDDLVAAISWAINHPELQGPINMCAPQPLTQAEFGRALAHALGRPFWLPMPEFALKMLFGEGAQVLTHSSCVVPSRLTELGFQFKYADAKSALSQLVRRA